MKKSDLLAPFGFLYGAIVNIRRKLYEKDIFKSFDLGVPTISIGNITAGGTGKTPLVAFAARILAERGEKVCILTRGYGRGNVHERVLVSNGEKIFVGAEQAGDEPFELAKRLLGMASVVADASRVEGGSWALKNLGATAFVLDDAFQHLKVKRALDILCIDASNPFGNGNLLPFGILRETLPNLKRADAIVITRANLVGEKQIFDLKAEILQYNQDAKIFVSENKVASLKDLKMFLRNARSDGEPKDKGQTTKAKAVAFCALGNPESFFEQLRREGFNLICVRAFPDHHFYTRNDIEELEKIAGEKGARVLLTTAKDAVKLENLKVDMSCFVVESEMIFDNEAGLKKLIEGAVARPAPSEFH